MLLNSTYTSVLIHIYIRVTIHFQPKGRGREMFSGGTVCSLYLCQSGLLTLRCQLLRLSLQTLKPNVKRHDISQTHQWPLVCGDSISHRTSTVHVQLGHCWLALITSITVAFYALDSAHRWQILHLSHIYSRRVCIRVTGLTLNSPFLSLLSKWS